MNLNILLLGNEKIKENKIDIYELNNLIEKLKTDYKTPSKLVEHVNLDDRDSLYLCYPTLKMELSKHITKRIILMNVVYPFYELYINKYPFAAYKTPHNRPLIYGKKDIIVKAGLECWGSRDKYEQIGVYPDQDWLSILIQYLKVYLDNLNKR